MSMTILLTVFVVLLAVGSANLTAIYIKGYTSLIQPEEAVQVDGNLSVESMILTFDGVGKNFCVTEGFEGGWLSINSYSKKVTVYCYGKSTPYGDVSKEFELDSVPFFKSWRSSK